MSILNVWRCDEYAMVACDTIGVAADGSRYELVKLLPLPQFPGLIAGRGESVYLHLLFACCFGLQNLDFDGWLEAIPLMLPESSRKLAELQAAGHAPPNAFINGQGPFSNGHEVVVVGWSPKEQRIIAREYRSRHDAHEFDGYVIENKPHIAPWDERFATMHEPRTTGDMERVAHAQVALMVEKCPAWATGGQLIIARLDEGGISMKRFDLEAPAATTAGVLMVAPDLKRGGAIMLGAA